MLGLRPRHLGPPDRVGDDRQPRGAVGRARAAPGPRRRLGRERPLHPRAHLRRARRPPRDGRAGRPRADGPRRARGAAARRRRRHGRGHAGDDRRSARVDDVAAIAALCARARRAPARRRRLRRLLRARSPTAATPASAPAPFAAIARADSVVVDPHKHGLQPYGCGCVLFADPAVGRLYAHDSPYTYFTSGDLHLGEISLECSRAGRERRRAVDDAARAAADARRARPRTSARRAGAALARRRPRSTATRGRRSWSSRTLDIVCVAARGRLGRARRRAAAERAFDTLAQAGWHVAKLRVDTAWLRRAPPRGGGRRADHDRAALLPDEAGARGASRPAWPPRSPLTSPTPPPDAAALQPGARDADAAAMPRHRPHAARRRGGRWSRAHARRLLWRAGFGATPAELDHFTARGRAATIDWLLRGGRGPHGHRALVGPAPRGRRQAARPRQRVGPRRALVAGPDGPLAAAARREAHALLARPLRDARPGHAAACCAQNRMLRAPRARLLPRPAGRRHDRPGDAGCSSRWPTPTRTQPNENYARELHGALHARRRQRLPERDVREAARALTGFRGHWADGRPVARALRPQAARPGRQAHLRQARALRLARRPRPRASATRATRRSSWASCGPTSSPSRSTTPRGARLARDLPPARGHRIAPVVARDPRAPGALRATSTAPTWSRRRSCSWPACCAPPGAAIDTRRLGLAAATSMGQMPVPPAVGRRLGLGPGVAVDRNTMHARFDRPPTWLTRTGRQGRPRAARRPTWTAAEHVAPRAPRRRARRGRRRAHRRRAARRWRATSTTRRAAGRSASRCRRARRHDPARPAPPAARRPRRPAALGTSPCTTAPATTSAATDAHAPVAGSAARVTRRQVLQLGLGRRRCPSTPPERAAARATPCEAAEAAAAAAPSAPVLVSVFLPGGLRPARHARAASTDYGRYADLRPRPQGRRAARARRGTGARAAPVARARASAAASRACSTRARSASCPASTTPTRTSRTSTRATSGRPGWSRQRAAPGWLGRWLDRHGGADNPLQGAVARLRRCRRCCAARARRWPRSRSPGDAQCWIRGVWGDGVRQRDAALGGARRGPRRPGPAAAAAPPRRLAKQVGRPRSTPYAEDDDTGPTRSRRPSPTRHGQRPRPTGLQRARRRCSPSRSASASRPSRPTATSTPTTTSARTLDHGAGRGLRRRSPPSRPTSRRAAWPTGC